MKFINIFLIKDKPDLMAFFFLFIIVFFTTAIFIYPASALIPADNIADNQSYIAEPNTNTSFDPENNEVFEPEETAVPPPIPPSQITSSSSGSSSSGGGGGGGVVSSENYSNILQHEQHEGTLIAGQPVSFKFNLSIYEILLTGKENEYDVSVRVELLKDKPQKATVKPDGEVISYFNVITSTKRLKEATIRFKTNISGAKLKLMKWNNSSWIESNSDYYPYIPNNPEARQTEDKKYTHYQAKTDSFSSFVIVKSATAYSNPSIQPSIVSTVTIVSTPKPTSSNPVQQSPSIGIIGVFCAMLIIKTKYYKNK